MKIDLIIPSAPNAEVYTVKKLNKNIRPIIISGKNPSKNRNLGIKKAKSDLIAFTNAHTILDKKWYKRVNKFFLKNKNIDIVGGPQLNYKYEDLFARSSGYALGTVFATAKMSQRYTQKKLNLKADEKMITSANLICKKKVFKKINFDEKIYPGEDPKFVKDAIKNGFNVAYDPEIIVYNKRRTNINGLFRQIFRYGLFRPKIDGFKGLLKQPIFFVPSLFVIYLIVLPFLLKLNSYFLFPLLVYIFMDILFSFYLSLKEKDLTSFLVLPIIFIIIHIAYGLGIMWGIFKK